LCINSSVKPSESLIIPIIEFYQSENELLFNIVIFLLIEILGEIDMQTKS